MSASVDRLVAVVEALRDHCPWTAALTHADLAEYLVEEAYEAVAEIEARDPAAWSDVPARRADGAYPALAAELGDVLFQVVLHAAVSRAPGAPAAAAGFRVADAADALTAKMIRRNPLVLTPEGGLRPAEELAAVTPEAVELAWERVKAAERAAAGRTAGVGSPAPSGHDTPRAALGDGVSRPLCGAADVAADGAAPAPAHDDGGTGPALDVGDIPARLPALAAAAKLVDRAARQEPDPIAAHAPTCAAEAGEPPAAAWPDEAALGAELFALVRRARAAGLDPERALRGTVSRVRAGDWAALRPSDGPAPPGRPRPR